MARQPLSTEGLPARRHFGDKEIAKILKRASELQRAEPTRPDPSGLTLAELEEIAVEAGIDLGNLRRAVSELDTKPNSGFATAYLGAPTEIRFERTVSGELTPDDYGRMIPVLQSLPGTPGQATVIGRTLTWTYTRPNSSTMVRVLVMSENDETLIRLEETTGQLAGGLHGGLVGGGGFGLGIAALAGFGEAGAIVTGVAVAAGLLAGTYVLARTIYKNLWSKRNKEMSNLFDRLVSFAEETAQQPALGTGEVSALPNPGTGPDQ